jgi:hypothetical protein
MRHWPRRAVLLVALLAPAAVAQSSRPAPGANELFAALAAPDHDARTERLRAIRGLLAEPGDARAVTVARAQLDGLLAAEAGAAAEQPPPIVMAALAGRIDGAISRLEKAAASGGEESEAGSLPAYAWPALCGLAAVQTLGLLLGLTFMARRLRGAGRTQAVLTRLDQLSPRLDAVLARATLAEDNTADLRCAVSGALAELDAASRQTRASIEASVAGACARLNEAGAFIEHTERVASALPALMGEAVDSVQARGLPGLDRVVPGWRPYWSPSAPPPRLLNPPRGPPQRWRRRRRLPRCWRRSAPGSPARWRSCGRRRRRRAPGWARGWRRWTT